MKDSIKKQLTWSNALFALLVVAMLIPQTRMLLQSNLQRLFLRPPSTEKNITQLEADELAYSFVNSEGKKFSLESLSDKPIFLNYWATWCPPCVAEMPSIEKLYSDYKDKVHFVIVSQDDQEKLEAFMQKKGYTFPLSQDISPTPKPLQRSSIPSTFILSKNGGILVAEVGANNWNSKRVRMLLDEEIKR
jgi:thiol-disulfide isomerase/thioredoxin